MIEHCLSCLRSEQKEKLFRVYLTDALKLIAENTTHFLVPGVGPADYGSRIQQRWIELAEHRQDERTGDEIAADIISRAGLRFAGEGE